MELLSTRLWISIFWKDLVYFDLFIFNLVENCDVTQSDSLILNQFLEVFLPFNRKKFHGNYLVYDRIMRFNALLFALVLYELNDVDATTMV